MTRYRVGLVVGKFAPLHRGHELLIGRAQSLCDDLVIVSYNRPEFPGHEPARRRRWLETRFPAATVLVLGRADISALRTASAVQIPEMPPNDAPASEHRRFVGFLCREQLGAAVDAVFTSEDYGDAFAQELCSYYREARATYPSIAHVCVDKARSVVPISGSRIRSNVHEHREFLSPEVYASFVERVCVLGGESSGKTTLTRALAARFRTSYADEYGRTRWEQKHGALELHDMLHIAERQVASEEEAGLRAERYVFSDTSPLTTSFYSLDAFGLVVPELAALAQRRYRLAVLCAPDFPFVQDGTRRDAAFRAAQHAFYVQRLEELRQPYLLVRGEVPDRVAQVSRALAQPAIRETEWTAPLDRS